MAIEADKVVEAALEFEGTQWQHGACIIGVGVDCTQLVIYSFNKAGAEINQIYDYSLFDEFIKLVRQLNRYCAKVKRKKIKRGDILCFRGPDMHNHVGIALGPEEFIHAYAIKSVNKVVREPITGYWKLRLKGIYRHKELAD